MYIGEVSKQTGASPKAIRLYEKLGLIAAPERMNKYRYFSEQHVVTIQIIKKAQQLGFTLSEIKKIMSDEISCEEFPWEKATSLILSKIETNKNKIDELRSQNSELFEFTKQLKKRTF